MKFSPFVSLRPTEMVLGLARAKLAEVLCRLGDDVVEQLHLDAAQWFAA